MIITVHLFPQICLVAFTCRSFLGCSFLSLLSDLFITHPHFKSQLNTDALGVPDRSYQECEGRVMMGLNKALRDPSILGSGLRKRNHL